MIHAQPGAKLDAAAAKVAIQQALAQEKQHVALHRAKVQPKVTDDSLGHTVVVRLNENRLYLYDGFQVVRTFTVATAKPGFTTPTGVWRIYDKQVDPVWHNPALDGWGAGEPAVIPGGPGNPMGPRAIYITAPGLIRIHGTSDEGLDRAIRVARLHPDAQRRGGAAVSGRPGRRPRGDRRRPAGGGRLLELPARLGHLRAGLLGNHIRVI
jgi:hypothetical protein